MLARDRDKISPERMITRGVSAHPQDDKPRALVQMPTDTRDVGLALLLSPTGCLDRIERKLRQAFLRGKDFDAARAQLFPEIARGGRELRYGCTLCGARSGHGAIPQ